MLKFLSRTETKAYAAVGGSLGGVTISAAIVWAIGVWITHVPPDSAHAEQAVLAVPAPLTALVGLAVTGAITWLSAYQAPPSNHAGNPPLARVPAGDPPPISADTHFAQEG